MQAGELSRARGVALLMVMVAVAVLAFATTVPLRVQQTELQRERERELLFIGQQFHAAITSYRAATPGGVPQYPKTLDELLEDKRFPMPRRHLRRLYRDPFSGTTDWVLLREQGAIVGITSRSEKAPLLKAGFQASDLAFADARSHAEWRFVAFAEGTAAGAPAASAATSTPPADTPPRPPAQADAEAQRRAGCLSGFSQSVGQCWRGTSAEQGVCRNQARAAMVACMRG